MNMDYTIASLQIRISPLTKGKLLLIMRDLEDKNADLKRISYNEIVEMLCDLYKEDNISVPILEVVLRVTQEQLDQAKKDNEVAEWNKYAKDLKAIKQDQIRKVM